MDDTITKCSPWPSAHHAGARRATVEPKNLRDRLLHAAARNTRGGRRAR
ncbi:hypothetical protein [Streptomyces sp. NPDC002133]